MAENEDGQEKSEEATSRRLQQAREKGQVARSKELGTSAVLLAAAWVLPCWGQVWPPVWPLS